MLKGEHRTLWEKKLNRLFEKRKPEDVELLINLVSLSVYSRNNKDLGSLYTILGTDNFSKVISLFSGRTITFPDREEFREALIIAVCYYYKEILNYEWSKIKEELPFAKDEINSIKIGKGIKKLNKEIKKQFFDLFSGDENYDE